MENVGAWQVRLTEVMIFHEEPVWKSQTHSPIPARPGRRSCGWGQECSVSLPLGPGQWGYQKREMRGMWQGMSAKGSTSLRFSSEEAVPLSSLCEDPGRESGLSTSLHPWVLSSYIVQPPKSEPSWSELREEGILQRVNREGFLPQGLPPVPEPIKTVSCHPQCYMLLTLPWVCRKGSRPPGYLLSQEAQTEPSRCPPTGEGPTPHHLLLCGCQQPSHCVIILTWVWFTPSPMSPKGTPWALSSKPTSQPFLNWVKQTSYLSKQGEGGLNGTSQFLKLKAIAVMTHTCSFSHRQVLVSWCWFAWNHSLSFPRNIPF